METYHDKKMNNKIKLGLGLLTVILFNSKKTNSATGGAGTVASNGFIPTIGTNGSLNESYLGITPTSTNRGIRNNNPTNIKFVSGNNWLGKIPYSDNTDNGKTFEQFYNYASGVRAAIYILKNAYIPNGKNTPLLIVNRWANTPTSNYAAWLANRIGFGINDVIPPTVDNFRKLVQSIARWENGRTDIALPEVITNQQFDTAYYQVNNF